MGLRLRPSLKLWDRLVHQSNLVYFSCMTVPPTIAPLEWTPIEAGHRTSKTCQVPTGDYPIRITWYWNGKIIRSTPEKTIYNNDFLSHLQFSEVKAEYRGRYTCKAENNAGSASYSAELVVHGKTHFLICYFPLDVIYNIFNWFA